MHLHGGSAAGARLRGSGAKGDWPDHDGSKQTGHDMATFSEFMRMARLGREDKTSGKRMRQILSIVRKYHITKGITPQQAVSLLEELGPTYVKIGQMASTRSDILPKEYCEAFEQLHADVTPMPYEMVTKCLDDAYGKPWTEVFLALDPTPLGSASIAQVHKAVLFNGDVVAVKVRRPGIVEQMSQDIALMKKMLATAEFFSNEHQVILLNFENLVDELERTTANEVNFDVELNNLIKFHIEIEDYDGISSPIPYPRLSNESVLVMEYVDGIPIDDVKRLKEEGDDPHALANRLVQNYVSQVLDHGFFHADPHPGNIVIRGKEIVWIDLGMVGTLTGSERQLVGRMFRSVATNDPFMLMEAVVGISRQHGDVDEGKLMGKLSQLLEKYGSADLSEINMGEAFSEMIEVMRKQNLIMLPSVTMLVRGLMTIEGVLDDIAPQTNVMDIVSKHVVMQSLNPKHIEMRATELANSSLRSVEAMTKLPAQLTNTLTMLNRGELAMRGNVSVDEGALSTVYASVGRLSLALISVGLFLGSSIICTTNMQPKLLEVPLIGFLGFVGAFILGVYVIVVVFKSRHAMKNNRKAD